MTFDVNWSPDGENELAAVWMKSFNREAVSRASNTIDRRLMVDADDVGESRGGSVRIEFESPLGVLFSVDLDNRSVSVFHVWEYET